MIWVSWLAVNSVLSTETLVFLASFETVANRAKTLERTEKQGVIASMGADMIGRFCGRKPSLLQTFLA